MILRCFPAYRLLLIGDDYGKFGTKQFAQTATHAFILFRDDREIIALPVKLVGFFKNLKRAEFDTYFTPLTKAFVNLYQLESSLLFFRQIQRLFTKVVIFSLFSIFPPEEDIIQPFPGFFVCKT